jgi:mRNA interferase HigB
MRVISRKTLKIFWKHHADAEGPLRAWFHEAKAAKWKSFQEIKRLYPAADVRPNNRVIFNIKGNHYRLIVKIHYNTGIVFIRFVGTHPEYDRINPDAV